MKEHSRENFFDLNELLHPADAFDHPSEVVHDPNLTLSEKRAILASWASDACVLEAAPELRKLRPERPVTFDDIMEALRMLDTGETGTLRKYQKVIRRRALIDRSRGSDDSGTTFL